MVRGDWWRLLRPAPWLVAAMVAAGSFALVAGLRSQGQLQRLELWVHDVVLLSATDREPLDQRIALVGITEGDIRRLGRWPMDFDQYTTLFEVLIRHYKPRVIGLDLYLDHLPPPVQRQSELTSQGPEVQSAADGAALNDLLDRHDDIIVPLKLDARGAIAVGPPPLLADRDHRLGFTDLLVDQDGVVRRGLLFLDDGQRYFTAFGAQLAFRYLAAEGVWPVPDPQEPSHLRLGNATFVPLEGQFGPYVHLDARGYQFHLQYRGAPQRFPHYSLFDVLERRVPQGALADRVVLIGAMADTVKDIFLTPFSDPAAVAQDLVGEGALAGAGGSGDSAGAYFYNGIEVHAFVVSQLLKSGLDGAVTTTVWPEGLEYAWCLGFALLGAGAGLWMRSLGGVALIWGLSTGVALAVAWIAMAHWWWLPVVPPILAGSLAMAVTTAYALGFEGAQRRLAHKLLASHVSPEVAATIWRHRDQLLIDGRLRPRRLEATVLFADLVGFTPVAEGQEPEQLMVWLNQYAEAMAKTVMVHGGFVDKFIGDAVMAIFGMAYEGGHSRRQGKASAAEAVACALAMTQALEDLNTRWRRLGLPRVGMRIGIHTGPLVVGHVGSRERLNFTALGDTVNTAARLESYGKQVIGQGSYIILISDTIASQLDDTFYTLRQVGEVALKGKARSVTVYQVMTPVALAVQVP
ncbi:MAG: CHASE2 domain-containing protein [Candidatus Competibacterales bacterium]